MQRLFIFRDKLLQLNPDMSHVPGVSDGVAFAVRRVQILQSGLTVILRVAVPKIDGEFEVFVPADEMAKVLVMVADQAEFKTLAETGAETDDEVKADRRRAVGHHLRQCPACAEHVHAIVSGSFVKPDEAELAEARRLYFTDNFGEKFMTVQRAAAVVDQLHEWFTAGLSERELTTGDHPVAQLSYFATTLAVLVDEVVVWDDQTSSDDEELTFEFCRDEFLKRVRRDSRYLQPR